ncbi:MAG: substrate-binding domain-containing protein [Methylophaga sp.]|nr:substrate-binding domain-containing protein [Methylophaga sp.]
MKKIMMLWAGLLALSLSMTGLQAQEILKMSTTTSTDNSGLLKYLHEHYQAETGVQVAVIAVGTGKALKLGANGDVDIALVHAPAAELEYVEQGYFVDRKAVMFNDFVIVGPQSDPADIKEAKTAAEALAKIADSEADFVSRGDDSGTHKKELALWQTAGIEPEGSWYIAAGQGMGAVLKLADEKLGYALTDRGTQIAFAEKMDLVVLNEGDAALGNPYHIMAVNPEKHPHARYDLARQYTDFITSKTGQQLIADFKVNGQQLFYPNAE